MNNPNIVDGRRIYNPDELTGPNYLVAGSEQAATRAPTTRAYTDAAGLWVCCRFGAFGSKMSPLIQSRDGNNRVLSAGMGSQRNWITISRDPQSSFHDRT